MVTIYHISDSGVPAVCQARSVEDCPKSRAGDGFHGDLMEATVESERRFEEKHELVNTLRSRRDWDALEKRVYEGVLVMSQNIGLDVTSEDVVKLMKDNYELREKVDRLVHEDGDVRFRALVVAMGVRDYVKIEDSVYEKPAHWRVMSGLDQQLWRESVAGRIDRENDPGYEEYFRGQMGYRFTVQRVLDEVHLRGHVPEVDSGTLHDLCEENPLLAENVHRLQLMLSSESRGHATDSQKVLQQVVRQVEYPERTRKAGVVRPLGMGGSESDLWEEEQIRLLDSELEEKMGSS